MSQMGTHSEYLIEVSLVLDIDFLLYDIHLYLKTIQVSVYMKVQQRILKTRDTHKTQQTYL